jgi:hypothetical protein
MINLFSIAIIILFAGAMVVNAAYGRWNEAIYSFAAILLNYVVYYRPFH